MVWHFTDDERGQPSLATSIHGAVCFGQREGRNLDIEILARLIDHLVGTIHRAKGRRERAARCVFKALPWRQHRLFAHDAWTADLFHFSYAVSDYPMSAQELNRIAAFVRNGHGVEKEPLALRRARSAWVKLRSDTDADVFGYGFGGEHFSLAALEQHSLECSVYPMASGL